MAESHSDSSKSQIPDVSSGCSSENLFDFKNCEESLPTVGIPCDNLEEVSSDEEYSDANDICSTDYEELDEEALSEKHINLTDEQLQELKEKAIVLKNEGNKYFKEAKYAEAMKLYTNALNECPVKFKQERAILFSNRAAAKINLDKKEDAVIDCNKAIEIDPNYLKAVLRRAQLHRKLDNLERSLEDYRKVMELDKNNNEARQACATMPAEIEEKNEKLKQEMFGKLKELGNFCLRPFGLSTDNFKVVQDPQSGGYSINFSKE